MRMTRVVCWFCTLAQSLAIASSQILPPSPQLPDVRRGEHVILHLVALPTNDAQVAVSKDGRGNAGIPLTIDQANRTASFVVDSNLPPGRYLMKLMAAGREELVPGELRVLADNAAPVHIDAIYPSVRYPDTPDTVEIAGANFAAVSSDNKVEFLGPAVEFGTGQDCKGPVLKKPCVFSVPGMEDNRIRISGLNSVLKNGVVGLHVRVAGTPWSNVLNITTVPRSVSAIRLFALALLAILALLTYLLSKRAAQTQATGSGLSALSVLLLDPETDTYSLSKFQVLVWTAVFIFSYAYLTLCRTLVQSTFDWPPVPKNMPELLGISAGAGVLAAGISSLKGTKGAGGIRPSAADFITTGGIVAGERLQFFIWTIVGGLTFLYIILRINPGFLQELPTIPDTFLYLMGFSSAAYLGGKLARKPGPVIKNVSVQKVTELAEGEVQLDIVLEGENLHQNANFLIDREQIRASQLTISKKTPEKPQDGFCTTLEVAITQSAKCTEGVHTLTIVNPDGQSADVAFPVSPLIIKAVDTTKDNNGVYSAVTGENFVGAIKAQWAPNSGGASVSGTVDRTSDVSLNVTLPAGTKGTGKLVLISSIGLRQSYPVKIE
jgi:hypothetical protein